MTLLMTSRVISEKSEHGERRKEKSGEPCLLAGGYLTLGFFVLCELSGVCLGVGVSEGAC